MEKLQNNDVIYMKNCTTLFHYERHKNGNWIEIRARFLGYITYMNP